MSIMLIRVSSMKTGADQPPNRKGKRSCAGEIEPGSITVELVARWFQTSEKPPADNGNLQLKPIEALHWSESFHSSIKGTHNVW